MTDRKTLESAILALGRDSDLLRQFRASPVEVGRRLGLDPNWAEIINGGNRDALRSAGVNDGITILVSRWFKDNLGDTESQGRFSVPQTAPSEKPNWPSNLAFAGGCSHVPDLLVRPEIDEADGVKRLLDGYKRLRTELTAAKPDAIVVTTDCHFQSFETAAFVVGVGATHSGSMAFFKRPDIQLQLKGDPKLAEALVTAVRSEGREIEAAPNVELDHGLIVPAKLVLPSIDIPVVPIVTQPARSFSPFSAHALGQTLRRVIERSGRRIAVLATGGLSHWLDPGKFGFIDIEFDTYILNLLRSGHGLNLANLEPYPLLSHGQYEFLNWIIMLGVVGAGTRGEILAYEPLAGSGGGWSVVRMSSPTENVMRS